MGFSHVSRLCLQGGGVMIYSATVSFLSCTITGNTAYWVRAQAQKSSHRPHGKNADALALILACTTANASVNHSRYVPQRPCNFPSPRWEFLLTCPIDSHLSCWIDIWFYQGYVRASHACKLPIAPMGDSCFARFYRAAVSLSIPAPSQ